MEKAMGAMMKPRELLAEAMIVTPHSATQLLQKNDQNRSISINLVKQYAEEMRAGRWQLNGETIKVAPDGSLIDGQHRLHACIQAGVPFPTMVMRGVDKEAFDTIDTGRKRTAGDALTVDGVRNANAVAAAARWVIAIHRGLSTGAGGMRLTAHETREFIYEHPGLVESCSKSETRRAVFMSPSMFGALHFLFSEKSAEEADIFIEDLATGADLSADDPVFMLRDRLVRDKLGQAKSRMPNQERFALAIRAWNARRKGRSAIRTLKGLVRKDDGTYQMPKID